MGTYYLVIGLGIFLLSIYIACSKYGNIVLGEKDESQSILSLHGINDVYLWFGC